MLHVYMIKTGKVPIKRTDLETFGVNKNNRYIRFFKNIFVICNVIFLYHYNK